MPIRFIKLLVAASLVLAPTVLPCVAANMPSAAALDAVNLAGRQRMLSQRIVKNYTQLGLGVLSEAADRQLRESIFRFDASQTQLHQQVSLKSASNTDLEMLGTEWHKLKPLLASRPNRDTALQVEKQAELILAASHQLTLSLQEASGSDSGRSGRTRMLS